MVGKTILVIGANGAFGAEICQQLIAAGGKVIGTARNADTSIRLRADLSQRLLLDLESQASIDTLANYLANSAEPIDGVVIAAGLVAFGAISDTPSSVQNRLTQVNALGPISLVSQLIPKLKESADLGKQPFVVSISGVIAESPMAGLAAYSSSKTAMHGYAIAAAKELKKLGIRWLDARPGHTESGLAGRAIFGTAPNFGTGMQVTHVVSRIIRAINSDEKDLPSNSF
jgi:NAD(P)-dependent dehydrogenase (short-subunit alcohol dehydrogenase family)